MSSAAGAPEYTGTIGSCRPLPPHPDVEFEKKRAKHLLRDAKAGDARALATMSLVTDDFSADALQLSLAQLAVAREYGFSSWVKLTQYYERWDRLSRVDGRQAMERGYYSASVKWLTNGHEKRVPLYGQLIATYLPRLFGMRNDEVFASPITESEAQFIVARKNYCASWDELQRIARADIRGKTLEARQEELRPEEEAKKQTPEGRAYKAMREGDLGALEALLIEHPELVGEFESVYGGRTALIRSALITERRDPEKGRRLTEWLTARGAAVQPWLNMSIGVWTQTPDEVEHWIKRGADPNWVWPNGYSTLEHALIMFNLGNSSPRAVEALARHVNPIPRAFWIAAGLGDVKSTMSYLDSAGKPTKAARDRRPDLGLLRLPGTPFSPGADDETVVYEAFWVAAINERVEVLAALLETGFPIDAAPFGSTTLHMVVGCASYVSCEYLLSRGADPDAPQFSNRSPRWLAAEAAKDVQPQSDIRNRIRDLLAAAPKR